MYHPLSISDILKTSWYLFKKNFITIIVFSVISYIILQALEIIIELIVSPDNFTDKMVVGLFLILTQAYSTLGLYKLIFTLIDSEYYEFEFKQVLPSFKMMISYLAVGFILAFIITNFSISLDYLSQYPIAFNIVKAIGCILAIYLFLRIMFFITFIVDDHSGPIESLRQSFKLTKGYILKMLVIFLLISVLILMPLDISAYYRFAFFILAFTYPFVSVVLAVTYRKLIYSHQDIDDNLNETL